MKGEKSKKILVYNFGWEFRLYVGEKIFFICFMLLMLIMDILHLSGYLKYMQTLSASPIITNIIFMMISLALAIEWLLVELDPLSRVFSFVKEELISLIPISIEFIILHLYTKGKNLAEATYPLNFIKVLIIFLLIDVVIKIICNTIFFILRHYYEDDTKGEK